MIQNSIISFVQFNLNLLFLYLINKLVFKTHPLISLDKLLLFELFGNYKLIPTIFIKYVQIIKYDGGSNIYIN